MANTRTVFDEVPEKYHETLYPLLETIHQNLNEDNEKAYDGLENIRLKVLQSSPEMIKALFETLLAWETQPAPLSWRQSLLLGGIYKDGFGDALKPNHEKAHLYFSLGEAAGSVTAIHLLGHLYSNAADAKSKLQNPDETKAAEIFFRAAEKGDTKVEGHLLEIFKKKPNDEKICFYASLSLFKTKKTLMTMEEEKQIKREFNHLAINKSKKFDELSDDVPYERIEPLLVDEQTKKQFLHTKWQKLSSYYLAIDEKCMQLPELNKLILSYLFLQTENYMKHAQKKSVNNLINQGSLSHRIVHD